MDNDKFYGKYRAIVTDVSDPNKMGRIKVSCPAVLGDFSSGWCVPCFPNAVDNSGDFCIPPVGEGVWVEFEGGNPEYPIYSGGWFCVDNTPMNLVGGYSEAEIYRIIGFMGAMLWFKRDLFSLYSEKEAFEFNAENVRRLNYLVDNKPDIERLVNVVEELVILASHKDNLVALSNVKSALVNLAAKSSAVLSHITHPIS